MPSVLSTPLSRHIPAALTGLTCAAVAISIHLYIQKRQKDKRRLRRSNARRIRTGARSSSLNQPPARTSSIPNLSAANQTATATQQANPRPVNDDVLDLGDPTDGAVLSNSELEQVLERATALSDDTPPTNQESVQDTAERSSEFSFSPETSKENQNLLNLLYLIAEVSSVF